MCRKSVIDELETTVVGWVSHNADKVNDICTYTFDNMWQLQHIVKMRSRATNVCE